MNAGSGHAAVAVGAVAVLAALGGLWLWGTGVKAGKRTEQAVRQAGRTGAVLGWGLLCAVVIVAVQWSVLTRTTDSAVWVLVLGLPGCFAGMALARYAEVTIGSTGIIRPGRRGDRR